MVAPSNNAHGGPFKSEGIDHYLVDFLEQVYAPTMLRGKSARYRSYFREAVKYLADALRRQPRFSDLNEISLKRFRERLVEFSRERRKTLLGAVLAIWRLVFQLGRAPVAPPKREYPKTAKQRAVYVPRPRVQPKPPLVGEPGTLVDFFNSVYLPQAIAQTSLGHRGSMLRLLRQLRTCFGRDLLLSELGGKPLAEFVAWMRAQGLGPVTVKNHRTRLLSIWRFANDVGEAPAVVRVPRLKIPREQPDAWSLEEVGRIISHARQLQAVPVGDIPASRYWPALLLTAWYTGLRRGALLAIRPEHLDLEERWLYVPASSMKNFVGKRFRLGEDAAAAIRAMVDPQREFVFGVCDRTDGRLWRQFKQILKNAGVTPSRMKLKLFHKMRRTTATHVAVKAGLAAASALLGHSTGDLLKRYIDPSYMVGTDATEWLAAPTP